jgi:uncharacterized protein YbjT (DUF2867 family)
MILVAGASGTLGSRLVSLLAERGEQVRVLTRDRARVAGLDPRAEVAVGDTGNPEVLRRAVTGVRAVVSAIHGFTGTRGATFIETWCEVLGRPLLEQGKTMVFGRAANPINWVSAWDVARFADLAAADPALRGRVIEVGGPENLTMTEFVRVFQRETGTNGQVRRIPRPLLRLGSTMAKPINPAMARQIQAALIMDTRPQAFDASATRRHYPSIPATSVAAVVRRGLGEPSTARGAVPPSRWRQRHVGRSSGGIEDVLGRLPSGHPVSCD